MIQISKIDSFHILGNCQSMIKKGLGSNNKLKTNLFNGIEVLIDGVSHKIKSVTVKPTKIKIDLGKIEFNINYDQLK